MNESHQVSSPSFEDALDKYPMISPKLSLDAHTLAFDTDPQSNRSTVGSYQRNIERKSGSSGGRLRGRRGRDVWC